MAKRPRGGDGATTVATWLRLIVDCHACQRPTPIAGVRSDATCAHCFAALSLPATWWPGVVGYRLAEAHRQLPGGVTLSTDFGAHTMVCRGGRDRVRCAGCREPLAELPGDGGAVACGCGHVTAVRVAGALDQALLAGTALVVGELAEVVAHRLGFTCRACGTDIVAAGVGSTPCPRCGRDQAAPEAAVRALVPVRPAPVLYFVAAVGR